RFLNLPVEARRQIRRWLDETRAPEEYGAFEPAAEAPLDAVARGAREESAREMAAEVGRSGNYRAAGTGPLQGATRELEEEVPTSQGWGHLRAASIPAINDERFAPSPYRDYGTYAASRPRSVALWRGIAVLAVATAIVALVVAYQRDVGTSLIWLGETLTGKT